MLTNSDISGSIFNFLRDKFRDSLKSTNKRFSSTSMVNEARKAKAQSRHKLIDMYRDNPHPFFRSSRKAKITGDQLVYMTPTELLHGNCDDYVSLGAYYARNILQIPAASLNTMRIAGTQGLDKKGGHSFLVIGLPFDPLFSTTIFGISRASPFLNDVYICDAWAGINCPATIYPMEFRMKMAKWTMEGKEILSGEKEVLYGGYPKTESYWMTAGIYGENVLNGELVLLPL